MARYINPCCKLCRAEGQKLFLKGARCFSNKCALARRQTQPGQHGAMRRKSSEYGLQIRAKQKARRFYGVLEKQFRHYYDLVAGIKEGRTGENLLSLIERRLDNVVYRLGWAVSRPQARQFVRHNNFLVNGQKVNIPSYIVSSEDILMLSSRGKSSGNLKNIIASNESRALPKWLQFSNDEHVEAKVVAIPRREDIDLEVEETLIVELYSK